MQADGFPSGVLTTIPVWLPSGVNQQATAASLAHLPSVHGAVAATGPGWSATDGSLVMVLPVHETATAQAGTSLSDVRHAVPPSAMVGGDAVLSVDETHVTYGAFPLMFARRGAGDVPVAGPGTALAGAADQGGPAQRGLGRGDLRDSGPGLAARIRHPRRCGAPRPPEPSTPGSRCCCSASCSASRWTTRSSSSPGCARPTTAPDPPQGGRGGHRAHRQAGDQRSADPGSSPWRPCPRPTIRPCVSSAAAWQRESCWTPPSYACCCCRRLVSLFGRANWWMPGPLGRLLRIPPQAPVPPSEQEPGRCRRLACSHARSGGRRRRRDGRVAALGPAGGGYAVDLAHNGEDGLWGRRACHGSIA